MKTFEMQIPTRVIFGAGNVEQLADIAKEYGKKALLVTTGDDLAKVGILDRVIGIVKKAGVEVVVYKDVEPNPKSYNVDNGIKLFKDSGCDFTIGLGGGSAMDTAKAIAVVAKNGGSILDFLPPDGKRINEFLTESMPCICITTTAGTGSEVTAYSVVTIPETKEKPAFGFPCMLPDVSIVDPELMLTVPKGVTASVGIDVFFHAMETYISKGANAFSEMCSIEAMEIVVENLEKVFEDGSNLEARSKMAWANTLGGFSLVQATAVGIHAMGHSISGITDIPHGKSLCPVGPAYMKYTWDVDVKKYAKIARILGANPGMSDREAAEKSGDYLKRYLAKFGLDINLGSVGLGEKDIDKIANDTFGATYGCIISSLKTLSVNDVKEILKMSL